MPLLAPDPGDATAYLSHFKSWILWFISGIAYTYWFSKFASNVCRSHNFLAAVYGGRESLF